MKKEKNQYQVRNNRGATQVVLDAIKDLHSVVKARGFDKCEAGIVTALVSLETLNLGDFTN